jgi:hypothetical protein
MTEEPLNPALEPSLRGTKQSPIQRGYRALWAIASFLAMTTVINVISPLFELFIGTRSDGGRQIGDCFVPRSDGRTDPRPCPECPLRCPECPLHPLHPIPRRPHPDGRPGRSRTVSDFPNAIFTGIPAFIQMSPDGLPMRMDSLQMSLSILYEPPACLQTPLRIFPEPTPRLQMSNRIFTERPLLRQKHAPNQPELPLYPPKFCILPTGLL